MSDLTAILNRVNQLDPNAAEELFRQVYDDLRHLAARRMSSEAPGQTLQPTALVHEAWLRLGADNQPRWQNRAHFYGAAAEAMRRILVDRSRRRLSAKHGGATDYMDVYELELPTPLRDDASLLRVNDALFKLAAVDSRKAELVKLRYFVGMNFEESAHVLGIAVPTAKQWWTYARAWLSVELGDSTAG